MKLIMHDDGVARCGWPGTDPLYMAYHDEEWGVPEYDSRALFEKLILDGFQAGLSWITILRKRDNFRKAFKNFEPEKIARFTSKDVERLMQDAGIIRNRSKIESTIKSARVWLEMQKKSDTAFADFLWSFVGGKPIQNTLTPRHQYPTESEESRAMSKALKKLGFNFCGPTIIYAFMQAVGMINDHMTTCHRHSACKKMGKKHG
ncbi:MAG: DNA-3-methyladenine glycosylase I [Pseudomonadota bacterium]